MPSPVLGRDKENPQFSCNSILVGEWGIKEMDNKEAEYIICNTEISAMGKIRPRRLIESRN